MNNGSSGPESESPLEIRLRISSDSGDENNVESGRAGDVPKGGESSVEHFDDPLLDRNSIVEGLSDLETDRPDKSNEADLTQSRPLSPIIACSHGTAQAQQAHLKPSGKRPREPGADYLAGPHGTEVEEDGAHSYGRDEQQQGEEPQSEHPGDVRVAQRVKSSNVFDDSDGEDSTSLDNPAGPRSGWAGFGADEVDRLVNSRWLNDQIITSVLRHLSAPVLEYVALTTYDFNSGQGQATVRSLLTRQSLGQGCVRYILAIVNQHDNHWVTLRLVLESKTCELYDSFSVRGEQQPDAREMLSTNLLPFLPAEGQMRDGWKLEPCTTCPQQENMADCGIFALLVASHLLSGLEVPATIDIASIALWRAIFAALGSSQSSRLADRLPEHLRDDLEDPQLTQQQQHHRRRHKGGGEVEEEVDEADGSEPTQTGPKVFAGVNAQLSAIDHKVQSMRDHYEAREAEAKWASSFIASQAEPFVSRWVGAEKAALAWLSTERQELEKNNEALQQILDLALGSSLGLGHGTGVPAHMQGVVNGAKAADSLTRRMRQRIEWRESDLKCGAMRMRMLLHGVEARMSERAASCRRLRDVVGGFLERWPSGLRLPAV